MAGENLKSAQITNMDAEPRVPVNSRISGSPLLVAKSTIATAIAAADTTSTYRMVRVPNNALISAVILSADDMGTTGDVNVGVYLPDGGAVVDADFFASGVDVNAAAVAKSDVTHESGAYAIEDIETPLYEALGHTVDTSPDGYDIVIAPSEAFTALGDLSLEVHYTR